jgi:hypothetical protein
MMAVKTAESFAELVLVIVTATATELPGGLGGAFTDTLIWPDPWVTWAAATPSPLAAKPLPA